MPPVIVISSSPTHAFAPSPTQVELSSPTKEVDRAGRHDSPRVASFKSVSTRRGGLSPGFVTARDALSTKSTAENVPLGVHSPSKFAAMGTGARELQKSPCARKPRFVAPLAIETDWEEPVENTVIKVLPADARRKKIDKFEPLNLAAAVARRQKWTPTKSDVGKSHQALTSFGIDLATSFGNFDGGYANTFVSNPASYTTAGVVKRRKVDFTASSHAGSVRSPVYGMQAAAQPKATRAKSPTKKSKTITALATSNCTLNNNDAADPMRQWLSSTQANINLERDPDTFETRVTGKSGKSKLPKRKSRLKSPNTVRSTLDSQELIFATCSQLARDESPTLLRDTIEAVRLSEQNCFSSPLRSQNTVEYSITPQKQGTARFHGRRCLWSVANRDGHEALLHNDNFFDQPVVMAAFAGQETLHQAREIEESADDPTFDSLYLLTNANPEMEKALNPERDSAIRLQSKPPNLQKRAYSTSAKSPTSKRTKDKPGSIVRDSATGSPQAEFMPSKSPPRKRLPPKPNYASWSDEDLKAAVKAHGFNRLRARKSMIDKLDERWAEQYGINPSVAKAATKKALKTAKSSESSNVLADVHHTAARPVPKVKQPRKRRTSPIKLPKASTELDLPRGADDEIIDISDIDTPHTSAFDRLSRLNIPDDGSADNDVGDDIPASTAPVRGTGVHATSNPNADNKLIRLATPPPTMPEHLQVSSPAFENSKLTSKSSREGDEIHELPASPPPTAKQPHVSSSQTDIPLASRILEALKHIPPNKDSRNHYKDPTWYEKILLYDPIVIEDFTAWLNTEGFNAINEDREIDMEEVKEWCQARSICCLWKGGWRGNKKTTKDDSSDDE